MLLSLIDRCSSRLGMIAGLDGTCWCCLISDLILLRSAVGIYSWMWRAMVLVVRELVSLMVTTVLKLCSA